MRVTGIIPLGTSRQLRRNGFASLLPLRDIIDAQKEACKFIAKWPMPAYLRIYYRCSCELAMSKVGMAYYNYVLDKPNKRKVVVFVDKMIRQLWRSKRTGPRKVYLGGALVHEFCHVQEYCNRLPIAFKQYEPFVSDEDRLLARIYDFICEAHAEEQCTAYIRQHLPDYRPEPLFKWYGCMLKEFPSPRNTYRKIARLINVCRLVLGQDWFYKVALNPPDFDDLSSPEDYAEWLNGI